MGRASDGGPGADALHHHGARCLKTAELSRSVFQAKTEGKGLAEVAYDWGLTYLCLHVSQQESEVGLLCHLQEN